MKSPVYLKCLLVFAFSIVSADVSAAVNIFACEPEWASLANELGGDKVNVFSATTARQDVHHIEARPSLIARVRSADLLICSGAELEIGWLPLLLTQSGNARIQPGSPGYLEASQFVPKLDVPKVVDRSMGDVHPAGNPHVHLDPRNIAKVGEALSARLQQIDPGDAAFFRKEGSDFQNRWSAALERWQRQAAPLKGAAVVVYHEDLSYFLNWAQMREAGALEPKPGVPPTPAHLAELVEKMRSSPANAVVYSPYNNPQAAEFLSERAKIPVVALPFTVGGTPGAKDLFGLFDDTIDRLLKAVK